MHKILVGFAVPKGKKCQMLTLADSSVVIISAQKMRKQN